MREKLEYRCYRCGEWLPLDAEHFHRDQSRSSGWCNICKSCSAKRNAGTYHTTAESRAARGAAPVYWGDEPEWDIDDLTGNLEEMTQAEHARLHGLKRGGLNGRTTTV